MTIKIEHEWLNEVEGPVEVIIYVYCSRRKKDMLKALHQLDLGSIEITKMNDGIRIFDMRFRIRLADPILAYTERVCNAAIVDRCVFLENPEMEDVIKFTSERIYEDQSMSKVLDRVKGLVRDHLQSKINAGRKPWEVRDGKPRV